MELNEITLELQKVPSSIFECDIELVNDSAHLDELKEALELAELNSELAAVMPEKSNEDTRKKLREKAVSESPQVKSIKRQIRDESIKKAKHESERAQSLRQFQALIAIAELSAARLNAVAMKTRKESLEWELKNKHSL